MPDPQVDQDLAPREIEQAIYRAFSTEDGQIAFDYLMRRFGYEVRTTHVPGDPATSAFNEGQRTVTRYLRLWYRRGSVPTDNRPTEAKDVA